MSKDDRTLNKGGEKRILSKTVLSSKGKESVETMENNFKKERFNQGKEKIIKFGDLKNLSFSNSKRT